MTNLTLKHLLEYTDCVHVRDEDWHGTKSATRSGHGDYGIVAEPCTVHLNWLPPLTVLFPTDYSLRRRND